MSNKATAPIIPVNKTGWIYDYVAKKIDQILHLPDGDKCHVIQYGDNETDAWIYADDVEVFDTREECEQAHEMSKSLDEAKRSKELKELCDYIQQKCEDLDIEIYEINDYLDDHQDDYDFDYRLISRYKETRIPVYREALDMMKKKAIIKSFKNYGLTNIPFDSIDRISNSEGRITIETKAKNKYTFPRDKDENSFNALCLIFDID